MDYHEFKRHLGKAGLTAREFAELVRLNPNSLSNYSKTQTIPSHWAVAAALMGEMADKGLDFRAVLSRIEIAPKKIRGAALHTPFSGKRLEA
jgi:hypothetical protein